MQYIYIYNILNIFMMFSSSISCMFMCVANILVLLGSGGWVPVDYHLYCYDAIENGRDNICEDN